MELEKTVHLVAGVCTAAIRNVLTEYLSDELANALTEKIALELMKAVKEIETEPGELICTSDDYAEIKSAAKVLAIKKFRKKSGIKQSELADILGVAKSTISMWETGERKPDIVTLKRIAELFQCTADELLEPIET